MKISKMGKALLAIAVDQLISELTSLLKEKAYKPFDDEVIAMMEDYVFNRRLNFDVRFTKVLYEPDMIEIEIYKFKRFEGSYFLKRPPA